MKLFLLIMLHLSLVSCNETNEFDNGQALLWSKQVDTTQRVIASSYSSQRSDSSWIFITTAYMEDNSNGLCYSGGEILQTGYLVYPGAKKHKTIESAISAATQIKGKIYASK